MWRMLEVHLIFSIVTNYLRMTVACVKKSIGRPSEREEFIYKFLRNPRASIHHSNWEPNNCSWNALLCSAGLSFTDGAATNYNVKRCSTPPLRGSWWYYQNRLLLVSDSAGTTWEWENHLNMKGAVPKHTCGMLPSPARSPDLSGHFLQDEIYASMRVYEGNDRRAQGRHRKDVFKNRQNLRKTVEILHCPSESWC